MCTLGIHLSSPWQADFFSKPAGGLLCSALTGEQQVPKRKNLSRKEIVESLRLEKTSQITKPNPTPPCPLPTSLSATSPRLWDTSRDGDPTTPCATVPLPHRSLGEGIVPNSQPEPPLAQRQAIPPRPVALTWEKRLTPISLQPPSRSL